MGVWIEITTEQKEAPALSVTPLVGVWIEIVWIIASSPFYASLPLWECGLKLVSEAASIAASEVTPLVGVWIEMNKKGGDCQPVWCHSPCGSVD